MTEDSKCDCRVVGTNLRSTLFSNIVRRLVTSVFSLLILNALQTHGSRWERGNGEVVNENGKATIWDSKPNNQNQINN